MARLSRKPTYDLPRRRRVESSSQPKERPFDDQQLFKRNRTLTGSVSSRVVGAANESNSHLKSSRVHFHELANHRRRIGGVLVVVLALVVFLSVLLWQFTAVVRIETLGLASSINTTRYESAIQDYYGQRPFERFRFAVNEQQLTEHVQQTLPEVRRLQVDGATGFSESMITIEMRNPIAGWKLGNTQYYVDASGASFTTNHHPSPSVQIVDESGVDLQLGQTIASNRFLGYVGRTVALTAAQDYKVTQVIIPPGTTRQIELQIEGVAYPALLLIDRPVGEQVEDMVRSIRYFQQRDTTPQYIDVRVSGKAFYR